MACELVKYSAVLDFIHAATTGVTDDAKVLVLVQGMIETGPAFFLAVL